MCSSYALHPFLTALLLLVTYHENVKCADVYERFQPAMIERVAELGRRVLGESFVSKVADVYFPVHAPSPKCRSDSQRAAQGLQDGQVWALRMFDASTKPVSGFLDGNFRDLGNFQQCLRVESPDGLIAGKHCVVRTKGLLPPALEDYLGHKGKGPVHDIIWLDVMFALCVPTSCSADDVSHHVNAFLAEFNVTAYVREDACSTTQPLPLQRRDWLAISIVSAIILLVTISTSLDVNGRSADDDWLAAFSLRENYQSMVSTTRSQDELTCVPGLRVLANALVIIHHRALFVLSLPVVNYFSMVKGATSGWKIPHMNMIVDVFFLIGGTLRVYTFLLDRKKSYPLNFFRSFYQRYFRLVPVVAAVALFTAVFLIRAEQGPLWASNTYLLDYPCQVNWWSTFLLLQNYITPENMCLPHLYYLANDYQLYMLSPLLLIPLYRLPRLGLPLLVSALLAMVTGGFVHSYVREIPVLAASSILGLTGDSFINEYVLTHIRPTAYLLGMILGWFIFKVKFGKWHVVLSKRVLALGWFSSLILFLVTSFAGCVFPPWGGQFHPLLDPLYNALARPLFAATFAWVILVCTLGYGGFLNTVLSLPIFVVLGRLSFASYVVHTVVVYSSTTKTQQSNIWDETDCVYGFFSDLLRSYFWAAVLYLTVEAPFYKVAMRLITKRPKSSLDASRNSKVEKKLD